MLPLTVGSLREFISDLPDDMLVLYERIEDVYFDIHHWTSTEIADSMMPEHPDEYIQANIVWSNKDKLLITAHF
jgi:hypothetical protein